MSHPYLVRNGERNPLYLAKYKSCIKGHRVTTPGPGFYPSFGGALAWLRAHKKEISTAVNLLRMYPETIEDSSLDPVWSYLEPLLECQPKHLEWKSARRRSKSAGDGSFTTSFENVQGSKIPSGTSRICKLPPLAATRYQAQFNSISHHCSSNSKSNEQDLHRKTRIPTPMSRQHSSTSREDLHPPPQQSEEAVKQATARRRQLFLLWRPQGGKIVHWPPNSREYSRGSWCSSTDSSDSPFLPEHDVLLNKPLSYNSYSFDSIDNWGLGGSGSIETGQPTNIGDLKHETHTENRLSNASTETNSSFLE